MYDPQITALQAQASKKLSDFLASFHKHYFSLIVDFKQAVDFKDDFMRYYQTAAIGVELCRSLEQLNEIEGNDNPAGLDDYRSGRKI